MQDEDMKARLSRFIRNNGEDSDEEAQDRARELQREESHRHNMCLLQRTVAFVGQMLQSERGHVVLLYDEATGWLCAWCEQANGINKLNYVHAACKRPMESRSPAEREEGAATRYRSPGALCFS